MAKEWWKNYFDENYLRTYESAGRFAHTKREINFLVKNIPLKKSDKILDLACGHGRHTIELAKRGYEMTGLDYSAYELDLARKEAMKQGLEVKFIRGDARNFHLREKFDVVINMFTAALGYGSPKDDKKIVENVTRVLKPGGKLLVETMNLFWLARHFKARVKKKVGKFSDIHERSYDFWNGVNRENKTIFNGKQQKKYFMAHRAYTLSALKDLLEGKGFKILKAWGSFKGRLYGFDTKRLMVLAKKA